MGMNIGPKMHKGIVRGVAGLLTDYRDEIEQAYRATTGPLKLALGVTIAPYKGKMKARVKMSFVNSKTEDMIDIIVDEDQREIWPDDILAADPDKVPSE